MEGKNIFFENVDSFLIRLWFFFPSSRTVGGDRIVDNGKESKVFVVEACLTKMGVCLYRESEYVTRSSDPSTSFPNSSYSRKPENKGFLGFWRAKVMYRDASHYG